MRWGALVSSWFAIARKGGRPDAPVPARPAVTPRPAASRARWSMPADGRVITLDPVQVAGSLQAALDRLRDGDTLVLRAGTYEGGAVLAGRRDVTVRGERGAIVNGRGREAFGLRVAGGEGVTIEGLAFRDAALDGLVAEGTAFLTIRGCEAAGNAGNGVRAAGCPGLRLEASYVHHNGAAGIHVAGPGERLSVVGCRIEANGRAGLALEAPLDPTAPGVLIAGNVIAPNARP